MEQLNLLVSDDVYNLIGLKEQCRIYIKKKYPNPTDDEDYDEYLMFLKDETDLEFAMRLRKMADEIEKKILEPLRKDIRAVYCDEKNSNKER